MILLKLSICFIVILAGIISTHGSESVLKKCPSASNVHKRSVNEELPKISRTKRNPGCMNLKLLQDDHQLSQNNDTAKINAINSNNTIGNPSAQTQVNRKKRKPNPARCDPKDPGAGPCSPPPPQTNLHHQTL